MSERANERQNEAAAVDATPAKRDPAAAGANLVALGHGNPAEVATYIVAHPQQAEVVLQYVQRTRGNQFASAVVTQTRTISARPDGVTVATHADAQRADGKASVDRSVAYQAGTVTAAKTTAASEHQGDASRAITKSDSLAVSADQIAGKTSTQQEVHNGDAYSTATVDGSWAANRHGSASYAGATTNVVHEGDTTTKSAHAKSAAVDIAKGAAYDTTDEESKQIGDASSATKSTKHVAIGKDDTSYATTTALDVKNGDDASHRSDARSVAYKQGTATAQRTSVATEKQGDASRSEEKADSYAISKDQAALKSSRTLEVHDGDNYSKQHAQGGFTANNNGTTSFDLARDTELHEGDRTDKTSKARSGSLDTAHGTVAIAKSDATSTQIGDASVEKKSAQAVQLGAEGNYTSTRSLVVKNPGGESAQSAETNAAYGKDGAEYSEVTKKSTTEGDKASSETHARSAAYDHAKHQVSGSESNETFKQDGKSSVAAKDSRDIVVGTHGGRYATAEELAVKNGDDESKRRASKDVAVDLDKHTFAANTAHDYYEKQGESSVAKSDAKHVGYANGQATYGASKSLEVHAKDASHKATEDTQIAASLDGGSYHKKTTDDLSENGKTRKESHDKSVSISREKGIHASQVDESTSTYANGKSSVAKKDAKSLDLDGDGLAMANSTETTAKNAGGSRTTGAERKLAINGDTGATHVRSSHESTTIGDKTEAASRTGTFNVGGKHGAEVDLADTKSTSQKDGDKVTTDERQRHANVNLHGADGTYQKTHTETNGDSSSTTSTAVKAGVHDGVASVDAAHTIGAKDKAGSHDASIAGGIKSDGSAQGSLAVKDVHKQGDTTTTHTAGAGVAVDKDGHLSANMGRAHTEETKDGKTSTATNAGLASDGTVSFGHSNSAEQRHADGTTSSNATNVNAHAGPNGFGADVSKVKKNADGSSSGASAGMDVDFKSGSVSAHAGYNLITKGGTSVKASVSHGTTVHAEVVKVGKEFEVQYVVSSNTGIGGGAGKGGTSVSVGANESDFESGSRHFATQKEAESFRDHAAEIIHHEKPPTSVAGALAIPIGESRGTGHTDGINASGSFALEGASVSASGHKSSTHELDIKRVSDKWVTVTDTKAGEKGHDFGISGMGLSNTKGASNSQFESVTYWFDLSTPEGQKAFQAYTANRNPPKLGAGVKAGPSSGGKAHEDHDNMHIVGGGDSSYHSGTSEQHVTDDTGSHKNFEGNQGHDLSPGWIDRKLFGGKEQHSSAELQSRNDNGKETYTAVVHLSGKDAGYNRDKMEELFNTVDDKQARAKAHDASGDWTLTADISAKTIHEVEANAFAGQEGHSTDAKMRGMSQLAAKNGLGMAGGLVQVDGKKNAWDVELKGDKNFPGHAGRAALDAERDKDRKTLMEHPEQANTIAASTQKTLDALHARQKAVGDRDRYTDLPEPLRQEQLAIIAQHITDFELLHNTALTKMMGGQDTPETMKDRLASKHGYDKLPPADREFAKEHDQIAVGDTEAGDLAVKCADAIKAVAEGRKGLGSITFADAIDAYDHETLKVPHLEEEQKAVNDQINALRPKYLDAATQREVAPQMAKLIQKRIALLKEIQTHLLAAAKAIRPGITEAGMNANAKWWFQYDQDTFVPVGPAAGGHDAAAKAKKHH